MSPVTCAHYTGYNTHMESNQPSGLARLQSLLERTRKRVELEAKASGHAKRQSAERKLAEDFAERLAEKFRIRRLMRQGEGDAERFRFYFTSIDPSTNIEELRTWIDHKMTEAETHAKLVKKSV